VTDAAIILAVQLLVNLISGVLILRGTLLFLNKPLAKWWIYCSALFAGWEIAAFLAQMPAFALNLPAFLFVGLIYIYTGYAFLKAGETEGLGRLFAGWGFIVWGIHKMNYAFLNGIAELAFWGYIASALLESAVACGTLLAYFQKIHRDLSNNERRFRLMAENARDIIYRFRLKPSRCFEYISPSSLAVTGYTPEEHYKNPDLIFWRFAQERFSINMVTKFIASGKGPLRMRMWHKDGRVVYTEHRIVPIYEEGSLAGFEGIARDITEIKQTEDALRESGRRFRDMLENVHLATVTIDEQGKIVYCNQYLLRLSGWSMAELIGRDLFETLIPKDKRSFHRRKLTDRIKNNTPDFERFEREIVARDGQTHIISWNTSLLRDADGRAVGISSIGEDISERKKSEGILKRYQLLSEHAWDIMLFLSREGRILEANNAALKAYGYSRDEILTKTMSDLRIPDEIESIEAALSEAETQGSLFEAVHRRRDGTTFPVEVSLQGAFIGEARVLLAVMRDITDRKRAEETINHLAYHDPLTDLPNRILFYDRLTVAIATARRNGHKLAVMFLDLDRFKYVNDMMGHAVGDQLLNDVACQLLNHVRKNDTVARMGGDEFTILLPEISHEEDAAKVAGNLIKILKKPWIANNSEVLITASIGIALFPNDGEDAETLTANADTAMYRAKEEGNSYQFYTSAMNFKTKERMKMENALKRAVEAKEFEVYYQPQFDTVAGRIVGVEALLRWRHPEKGLILPGEFISLAEDIGLIIPIGELVLRTACRQVKAWEAEGLTPIRLAVNLSAKQFRQKKLVQTIANVLQETGLEPSLLELEITETTAMQDIDFSVTVLKQFREMGINIAIDDFGTGYSSLNYLRRFPINKLKIDHSFVRDVLTDVDAAAIAATIIVLAQNMKLKVIIEGVETKEQLAFFSQQECHVLQGYLFSEPAPADEIAALLQKAKLQ
jgi:diguanylate cyclase (GGDEF)-like protein/PAS domain S-box-containing protein